MSDREHCKNCAYIKELTFSRQFLCTYPVPFWALPSSLVDPEQAITCPTFRGVSQNEEI